MRLVSGAFTAEWGSSFITVTKSITNADVTDATTTNPARLCCCGISTQCFLIVKSDSKHICFLLCKEVLWWHRTEQHTNHFYLVPLWEDIWNKWQGNILTPVCSPPLSTCSHYKRPDSLSTNTPPATCSSPWYNLRQIYALAGIPTPPHKNAVVPAEPPLQWGFSHHRWQGKDNRLFTLCWSSYATRNLECGQGWR